MPVETVSLLHEMEPFLGISFAVSLAYLGLPRFRYREEIRQHAKDKLALLQGKTGIDGASFMSTTWYTKVQDLAANGEHSTKLTTEGNGSRQLWDILYRALFRRKLDRKIIGFGCFLFAMLIFSAVGQKILAWPVSETQFLFQAHGIKYWYWASAFFAVFPIGAVYFGRLTVDGACEFINRSIEDMLKTLQQQVTSAPDPTTPKQITVDVIDAKT